MKPHDDYISRLYDRAAEVDWQYLPSMTSKQGEQLGLTMLAGMAEGLKDLGIPLFASVGVRQAFFALRLTEKGIPNRIAWWIAMHWPHKWFPKSPDSSNRYRRVYR